MTRHSYHERNYPFGQAMLTLRASLGLTQANLAERLGVSRRALADWEIGSAYPKADHLKAFLALCVGASAFAAGSEEEQIRALWRAARQKVLLDERWLSELLGRPSPSSAVPAGESSAAAAQSRAAAPEKLALWTVPYARNPYFTGRDDLLSELTAQLSPRASGQPMAPRCAALTQAQVIKGPGGIGKTQTAVEYAYRAREQGRYTHTLWISAASEEAILTSFADLAKLIPGVTSSSGETDQRKLVAAVLRWLECCKVPWLLLVDNADDLSMVQPYLPVRGNGSVLLTTRASAASWLAPSLEVDAMGVMEGAELLLRRAQRFAGATDEEINEAANLVVALAQFPLALDQAGAYIEETGCNLADYLQLFQTHRHALLARRGRQATRYPASVATTWELSFEHVAQTNPAAAELLRLCAFLSPDRIPEELLTGGASHWPHALQQAVADPFTFNQMLETLLAFSLVKRLSEDHLLSIHRLVQVVQVERLAVEEQRAWAERLMRALHAAFPADPKEDVASWPICLRYLEQVQVCDLLIQQYQLLLPEAAALLDRAGAYLSESASYTLAEHLYQRALHIHEQLSDPESPHLAEPLSNLALLNFRQGKYTEAEPLYQRALRIREQELGPDHLQVAASLNGLAMLYYGQGKYELAAPLLLRALRIREQHGGPEQIQMAAPLNNLAQVYTDQSKYELAEPLFQRAIRIREQQQGAEHPYVAIPLSNLASLYTLQGKYEQAEPLYQRALHIREQQLGPNHPDLAHPLHGLANLYALQEKYEQAEPLYQRALSIRENVLGGDSPLTTETRERLQEVLVALGQAPESHEETAS